MFFWKRGAQQTGKHALSERHSCSKWACSVLSVVGIYTYSYQKLKGYCYIANRSKFVIINGLLAPAEKKIVAAHEATHPILHKDLIKAAPLRDFTLYDMTSSTEYKANLFTADFLIEDEENNELSNDDDMNYFEMCQTLHTSPDLMSFKLFSLIIQWENKIQPFQRE